MSDTNISCRASTAAVARPAATGTVSIDGFLGLSSICLKLPDPVGNENTRYTGDYLSYLVGLANGSNRDFTTGTGAIPNEYRISVAQDVSTSLVSSNRALRIGLATFNPPTSNNSGNGGFIARSVSDLSPVSGSVTQAQADTNYNALIASINGLSAIANTPLAETYYEITRYMRGMAPYYNSTPTHLHQPDPVPLPEKLRRGDHRWLADLRPDLPDQRSAGRQPFAELGRHQQRWRQPQR